MPRALTSRRFASASLVQQLIIVVAAAAMYFANLGATALWDLDEALYSSIAREMTARGDWIVPTFNGNLFPEKPPLMFWLMMGSFKALGVSEFAARLPAALLAIGTALTTYHLARRLFSAEVGFWAGLVVSSNIIFTVSARAATVDSALTFITTLVMLLFAVGARIGEPPDDAAARASHLPKSWLTYAAIGGLLGLAILAKGPVGFLLPAASLGLFLLIANRKGQEDGLGGPPYVASGAWPRTRGVLKKLAATFSPIRILRVTWSMRPLTVLSAAALVAVPWFVLVALKTDGEWLAQFVTKFNLGPFVKPFLGHRGPFYYHFAVVLVGLFPWSIFLGPTIAHAWRSVRWPGREASSYLFVICWIGVFFGFWSVCSTKLPHYVLPAYPALAILTACFLDAWLKQRPRAAARHADRHRNLPRRGRAHAGGPALGRRPICSRRADHRARWNGSRAGRRGGRLVSRPRPAAGSPGDDRRVGGDVYRHALCLGRGARRPASAFPAAHGRRAWRQPRPAADWRLPVLRREHGLLCRRPGGRAGRRCRASTVCSAVAASLCCDDGRRAAGT